MSVHRAISCWDLMCYEESKEALMGNDEEKIKQILFSLGMDVEQPYDLESCHHRPLLKEDNSPWYGPRFVGVERQDEEYLKSGYASWEAKVAASNDPHLRKELRRMGATGSCDRVWIDESSAIRAIRKESN